MRITLVFAIVAAAVLVMASFDAEAGMHRWIYVNGYAHYFALGSDPSGKLAVIHQKGLVDDKATWLWTSDGIDDYGGSPACNEQMGGNMTAAVFDDKIFFAFTGQPNCQSMPDQGTHIYVATYDLGSAKFIGTAKDLGAVHVDNNGKGDMASAAIVVFNNLLYVFSDAYTYTSGDGVNWKSNSALSGKDMEPLDAITYYPPDAGPKIMIIYGDMTMWGNVYSKVYAATWNGQFGSGSDFTTTQLSLGSGNTLYACGGLLSGTELPKTAPGFIAGQKTPCLQLFLYAATSSGPATIKRLEYSYSGVGGQWSTDAGSYGSSELSGIRVIPWYTNECYINSDPNNTSNNQSIIRQNIVINYKKCSSQTGFGCSWGGMQFLSDAMVPQDRTIPIKTCPGDGGIGTDSNSQDDPDDPDEMSVKRKYWTLVGVVMGSPPFNVNEASETEIGDLSNVSYGQSDTTTVTHTSEMENSVIVSAGLQVRGGFAHVVEVEDQLDFGYKHAWESSHEQSSTSSKSYGFGLGTEHADPRSPDTLGSFGWGIYNMPTIIVQDYALYAYDYNVSTMSGQALDQDLHTTQVLNTGLAFSPQAYELENPGGENDDIPGLMTGIKSNSRSTDLDGWTQSWESNGGPYTVKLGNGTNGEPKLNPITFGQDSGSSTKFSDDMETTSSTGQTTDVDLKDGISVNVGTKLKGFKVDLAAGYEGHFSSSVTNTVSLGSDVEAGLGMLPCYDDDCIKTLTIQPFWLQAMDASASWIPAGYDSQLPWCMTWQVTDWTTIGGEKHSICPPPDQGDSKVNGDHGGDPTEEGEAGSSKWSSYSLKGGKLFWLAQDGTREPIQISAGEFDPSLGVSVAINGFRWTADAAAGHWTRNGDVWKFKSKESVTRDIVLLKLDFAMKEWDFDISKTLLAEFFKATDGRAHIKLKINGKYGFYFDCVHDVECDWDHKITAEHPDRLDLKRYSGWYNSATGEGRAELEGDLPEEMDGFGDMSFSINGRQFDIPLLSHKDFEKAVTKGKVLVYEEGGIKLSVDLGKGKWKMHFGKKAFERALAPHWGLVRIKVKVGGVLMYSAEHEIIDHTTRLKFRS